MAENSPKVTLSLKAAPYIDEDKNTELHYAAAQDKTEQLTEMLKTYSADPENYIGWTPLMMATRNGNLNSVELLLEHRANATKTNDFGFTTFLMAITSGQLGLVHLVLGHLLRGGISRASLQRAFSPVALAALLGYPDVIEYLLKKEFCINTPSSFGITPMAFAQAAGNTEIVQLLKKKGVRSSPIHKLKHFLDVPPPLVIVEQPPHISPQPFINPMVSLPCKSPMMETSQLHYTPQFLHPTVPMVRKSSNLATTPYFSPLISPIAGGHVQQIFFPSNFSPSHFVSPSACPTAMLTTDHEYFNMGFVQTSPMYSPFVPFQFNTPH